MKAEIIVRVWHVFALIAIGIFFGFIYGLIGLKAKQIKCRSLQILDCGHIVHNGDTVRFTTLPVK